MYNIVVFTKTNEVKCVPNNWFKSETEVSWPNSVSRNALSREIKLRSRPDLSSWMLYDVWVLPGGCCSKFHL